MVMIWTDKRLDHEETEYLFVHFKRTSRAGVIFNSKLRGLLTITCSEAAKVIIKSTLLKSSFTVQEHIKDLNLSVTLSFSHFIYT